MNAQTLMQTLQHWRERGWLRHLDVALARFILDTDPRAPASLALAAALLAHMEGRGHTGLRLDGLDAMSAKARPPAPGDATAARPAPDGAARDDPAPSPPEQVQAWTLEPAALAWPAAGGRALRELLRELWPSGEAARLKQWTGLDAVASGGEGRASVSPLVWCEPLLQLRRHWRAETEVARQVLTRAASALPPAPAGAPVAAPAVAAVAGGAGADPSAGAVAVEAAGAVECADVWSGPADALLALLFPASPAAGEGAADAAQEDEQKLACAVALRGRLTLITGGPGTGKTYTAARVLVALQALRGAAPPLRVALAAPTGKAAMRLRQAMSQALQELQARLGDRLKLTAWSGQIGPGRTLHALLGTQAHTRRFRHDASNPLQVDLLLVDEASMVHLELMAQLLQALPHEARLVLLGDRDQLASVEPGAVMAELCRQGIGDVALGSDGAGHAGDAGGAEDAADGSAAMGGAVGHEGAGITSPLAQRTVVLRRSRRFGGPIAELARCVNGGDWAGAASLLRDASAQAVDGRRPEAGDSAELEWVSPRGRTVGAAAGLSHAVPAGRAWDAAQGYRGWLQLLLERPTGVSPEGELAWLHELLLRLDDYRVLCALREGPFGVSGLNRAIEESLSALGLPAGSSEWYEGRPVMVTRNDAALGLFNGDIGIVLRAKSGEPLLRAHFAAAEGLRSVPVAQLPPVQTAFAMTIHKSQGSEFGHVALLLPGAETPVLTREALYTGITRARSRLTLAAEDAEVLRRAISRRTQRISGLGRLLRPPR